MPIPKLPIAHPESKPDLNNPIVSSLLIAIVCISVIATRYIFIPTTDIAWLTYAAEQLIKGKKFGADIYELNTPFAILLYAPSVLISRLFSISPFLVTYTLTTLCIIGCLNVSSKILRYREYPLFKENLNINVFRFSFLCAYLLLPGLNGFSQRDHLISALLLPYALIKLSPSGFKEHPTEHKYSLNLLSALLLAISLLIKPQYCFYIFIINLFSALKYKKIRLFKPGIYLSSLILVLGILSVIVYFADWLPLARDALVTYPGYRHDRTILFLHFIKIYYIPLAFIAILKDLLPKDHKKNFLLTFFCISTFAIPGLFIFGNGWYYHLLPIMLPLWGIAFFSIIYHLSHQKKYIFSGFIIIILILNGYFLSQQSKNFYLVPLPKETFTTLQTGDSFLCISSDPQCAFPLTTIKGYQYASRYPSLWPTAGAKNLLKKGKLDKNTFLHYFNNDAKNLSDDIKKHAPKTIVIQWDQKPDGTIEDFSDSSIFLDALRPYTLLKKENFTPDYSTWIYVKKSS